MRGGGGSGAVRFRRAASERQICELRWSPEAAMNEMENPEGDDRGDSEEGDGRGGNLSHEDRVRGGKASAAEQTRDDQGQFAGKDDESDSKGGRSGNAGG